ncbi:cat eye syndrome critical region protein 5 [Gaeumannomyces tritici R3-111a-1]|uniref:Cat eye syndrome critical region protein 5 n=1 Tax=Gaeumannomyces tritici (strain R3-111a-1) TaxID=644352 RepID=J3PA24_GAET3|nr:cat eye syndrome critical region protein 5 [Gaeumannomyces tritici R3-111a-1]EJT73510.1 cat eye syndrome critical region protein 5 [Gaeumannomyces tritici R3-111a-1]
MAGLRQGVQHVPGVRRTLQTNTGALLRFPKAAALSYVPLKRRLALSCPRSFASTRHGGPTPRPVGELVAPPFAFAFDIDGVLLHESSPIPGASEALGYLNKNHIPYILLTNGGGEHEKDRVATLSEKLKVHLTTDNFVQSHTPFQELAQGHDSLRDKTIFVTGSNAAKSREIAERYGFKNVVIPADILMAQPTVWPFEPLMESVYAATARPLPKPIYGSPGATSDAEALKIDAMFVFNDPRDWALDIQLIMDLLLSRQGYLGTYSAINGTRWQGDGQPALYFSNKDLFWSSKYHLPRFGQGAFQAAVAGVWDQVTGGGEAGRLRRTVIGKPFAETYAYAERVLSKHREEVRRRAGHGGKAGLSSVYMIGDNPESDIAGANEFKSEEGADWCSVLVRTGVWHPDRGEMKHQPRVIVYDVAAAVRWALQREGWKADF